MQGNCMGNRMIGTLDRRKGRQGCGADSNKSRPWMEQSVNITGC